MFRHGKKGVTLVNDMTSNADMQDPARGEITPEVLFDVLWLLSERSYRTGLLGLSEHLEDAMDLLLREWARIERNPARAAIVQPPALPPLGRKRRHMADQKGQQKRQTVSAAMPAPRKLRRAARARLLKPDRPGQGGPVFRHAPRPERPAPGT